MLKVNTTLTQLNVSGNEIGGRPVESEEEYDQYGESMPTPEGPAALAEGLAANSSVTQVNVSWNRLGTEGGKALADCLKTNTTITQVRRFVARPCVAHAVLHCAAALRCCAPPGGWNKLPEKRFRFVLPALSGRLWACFVRCVCRGALFVCACGCT